MLNIKDQFVSALKEFFSKSSINVEFPDHLYIPKGAESIDARVNCTVVKHTNTPEKLMSIKAKNGENFRFIQYAVYTDAEFMKDIEFIPKIDGKRILRLHGTPNENGIYRIALGLAPNMSETALIKCDINLKPNEVLTWEVYNKSDVDIPMAVRMVGYKTTQQMKSTVFR